MRAQRSSSEAARGAAFGIAAAVLFGLSAPIAKLLLPEVAPLMLASLLYLGAGAGLSVARLFGARAVEAPLRRADVPALLGVIVTGGIAGPLLMLWGLQQVSGMVGSLLLNLEAPFTMLFAVTLFREHLGRRELVAAALIVGAAAAVTLAPGAGDSSAIGALALAAACASWGIDNNLTSRLSLKDPIALVRIKTLGASACMFVAALLFAQRLPRPAIIGAALCVGAVSYGASILLDAHALRRLGAAREAALFATAPFAGALASIPILGERPTPRLVAGAAVMVLGVALLLRARHAHQHVHEELEHEHLHVHDEHHRHEHRPGDPEGEPHSHPHRHAPLAHVHPHVSDLHHRHSH